MASTAHCPDSGELARFLNDELDPQRAAAIESHLDACPACEERLDALCGIASVRSRLRAVGDESTERDVSVRSALQRLKAELDRKTAQTETWNRTGEGTTYVPQRSRRGDGPPDVEGLEPGTQLGVYEITELLGVGGMGEVYRATHRKLGREVALKVLSSRRGAHPQLLARFERELQVLGRLSHPNLVLATDAGEDAGMPFLVMELVEGQDVRRLVRTRGPLPVAEACEIVRQAAAALAHVHAAALVHRDVKPSNLMLARDGTVKLLDLGLARVVEAVESGESLTADSQLMGTLDYLAPEQAADSRRVDGRADLYSLGCTLFELLTGRPPFAERRFDGPVAKVMAHRDVEPPPLTGVPASLAVLVRRLLAKNPDDRPGSAAEVAAELLPLAEGADLAALTTPTAADSNRLGPFGRTARAARLTLRRWSWRWRRRRKTVITAALLVLTAAVVAAVWLGREAAHTRRLAEVTRRFEMQLDQPRLDAAYLDESEAVLSELSRLAPDAASEGRKRLHARFAGLLGEAIRRPRLSEADVAEIDAGLQALAKRDAAAEQALRKTLAGRLAAWKPSFELSAEQDDPAAIADAFADRLAPGPGGLLHTTIDQPPRPHVSRVEPKHLFAPPVASAVACRDDVRMAVEFDASWEGVHEVGLMLNADPGPDGAVSGYDFVVRVLEPLTEPFNSQSALRTFASVRGEGGSFCVEIRRNGTTLLRQDIDPDDLPAGALRLSARREGGGLTFQINGARPVPIYDPFPLGSRRQGVFALRASRAVGIRSITAASRPRPSAATSLERGDELFDQDDFAEAAEFYRRQALEADDPEFRQESQYKEALCRMRLGQADDARPIFESLFNEAGDRWPLLAGMQLWLDAIRAGRLDRADALFQVLSSRYSFAQLAALIPTEVREEIQTAYLRPIATVGGILRFKPHMVERVERAAAVDQFLSFDGQGQLEVQIELARAYRLIGDFESAARVLQQSVARGRNSWIVRNYVRVLRLAGRLHEALGEAQISINGVAGINASEEAAFRLDRAMTLIAMGRVDEAKADVLRALELTGGTGPGVDPTNTRNHARLMHGFLTEQAGDPAGATQIWRDGYRESRHMIRENRQTIYGDTVNIVIMGALSDELTDEDARHALHLMYYGAEDNPLFRTAQMMLSEDRLLNVIRTMWRTPRGREIARAIAYDAIGIRDRIRLPVILAGETYISQSIFDGEPSPDEAQVTWNLISTAIAKLIEEDTLSASQLMQLGLAWKGNSGFLGWGGVAPSLEPDFRADAALVFGHRYLRLGQSEQAARFLATAQRDAAAGSVTRRLASEASALLSAGRGRLVCIGEPAGPRTIEVRQGDQVVTKIHFPDETVAALPPGEYEVRDADGSDRPRTVRIRLAGTTALPIETRSAAARAEDAPSDD